MDSKWSCTKCTFCNHGTLQVCEICAAPRPTAVVTEEKQKSSKNPPLIMLNKKWICHECTFENTNSTKKCIQCGLIWQKSISAQSPLRKHNRKDLKNSVTFVMKKNQLKNKILKTNDVNNNQGYNSRIKCKRERNRKECIDASSRTWKCDKCGKILSTVNNPFCNHVRDQRYYNYKRNSNNKYNSNNYNNGWNSKSKCFKQKYKKRFCFS